jgi:hypothetical protein
VRHWRIYSLAQGEIVNVSSINARPPFPMVVDHSAARAALTNFTKALSEEFAPRGVRINAMTPGPVRTPFWTDPGGFADVVAAGSGVSAQTALDDIIPRNMRISTSRVTEADEVANLVAFLASPRAANITGAEFIIDGGQTRRPEPSNARAGQTSARAPVGEGWKKEERSTRHASFHHGFVSNLRWRVYTDPACSRACVLYAVQRVGSRY